MKTLLSRDNHEQIPEILPVIPTMDVVVFPHMIVPLLVMDDKIIRGINQALEESKQVLLLAAKQQPSNNHTLGTKDLYTSGTIASIMRLIKIPEGGVKVLVQGLCKAHAKDIFTKNDHLYASLEPIIMHTDEPQEIITAQVKNIKILTEKMAAAGATVSPDFNMIVAKMQDPDKIVDFILSHLTLSVEVAQELLETRSHIELLDKIYHLLEREAHVAEIQERIKNNARESMNKAQKEFYLREQLKMIKKELGEDDAEEIEDMRLKLEKLEVGDEIKAELKRHINRLERTSPDSMEATVTRNYLEWIFGLPWNVYSEDILDLQHAKNVLDQDHYGLKDVKDRILDFISVRALTKDASSATPILCLAGPPGTGKTSLGKSIARCLGRSYARISLGGVKDEAEIRGHRRTYVGAMPGRFIQAIKKAQSCNPVIVIDELDKIGADFRGDPSAAMLEVLDPQQNKTFYDNYLGIPFDLSKVLFVATANTLDSISLPLRDRMEVIELSGYTHDEKLNIAQQHLIRKALADCGLEEYQVDLMDALISDIVINYTQESGVRQLDRLIRKLYGKITRNLVEKGQLVNVDIDNIEQFLGPRKFVDDVNNHEDYVGISNGLAWTAYGGELLKIEAVLMTGKGKLLLTGQLGDVMKESAQAALSYIRAHAKEFGITDRLFTHYDVHIHVPAGAIPKDGPSAGITILTSLLSIFTGRPINNEYAMTGELNLRGEVMAIGGVKEKVLAAKRYKVPHIILPHKNKKDLIGLEDLVNDIDVIWVNHANEVFNHVLRPKSK